MEHRKEESTCKEKNKILVYMEPGEPVRKRKYERIIGELDKLRKHSFTDPHSI